MKSPDIPRPVERRISDETFDGLQLAMYRLFQCGVFANHGPTIFDDITIQNGMTVRYVSKDIRNADRPTHQYSGSIHPHGTRTPSYKVWQRFESSPDKQGRIGGEIIIPSRIVHEENLLRDNQPSSRRDFVTTIDGRAFEIMSTRSPNFVYADASYELDDITAGETTDWLTYLVQKAQQDPDAQIGA